jgi:heme/copper-type cytochrome/quinol oxidase subunit 3
MDKSNKNQFGRVVFFAALWFAVYTVCFLTIKKGSPDKTLGIILALLPIVTFALFIYSIIRGVASMDEVHIRIQTEAVVIAFSLGLLTLMTLGLLDLVIEIKKEDWGHRHLVPYFALFYFIGLIVSKRKYG